MKQFRIAIAIILAVSSLVVIMVMLFNPQPIQIVLETGQEVVTQSSHTFALTTVLILVVCSFVIGASITFLFYNAENNRILPKKRAAIEHYLHLLREDEKKVVRILSEHDGEMLQNRLVLALGLSKVKTTRLLASLERKRIITKERHGLTNHIKLV